MKKIVLVFLLFTGCNQEVPNNSEEIGVNKETITTSTSSNADLSRDNFRVAWEDNLKNQIELTSQDMSKTKELIY